MRFSLRVCDNCGRVGDDYDWIYVTDYGDHICETCADQLLTDDDMEDNGGDWFGTEIQEGDM